MKRILVTALLCGVVTFPAFAALKQGEKAPDFSAKASLAGQEFTFSLKDALKKGPVVVYFYPAAFTGGCNLQAHTFAVNKEKFDALGASIIGVSADSIGKLNAFSADPAYCAGKIAVASDPDQSIAKSYNLTSVNLKAGSIKDSRGDIVDHELTERTTFIITPDYKVAAAFSSNEDKISPAEHVARSLAALEQVTKSKSTKP
ncbi:MAG: redoxin domain-containing protein [Vicinamibacterales bacterium]